MKNVLIANRGEIARRIAASCRSQGLQTTAVYSQADAGALHVEEADRSIPIGPAAPGESYLNIERLVQAGLEAGADAVHPGYGFLSESPAFARAVQKAGMTWIGPDPDTMELMGDKVNARNRMSEAGVPVAAGSHKAVTKVEQAYEVADSIGYPIMLKAVAGGGGIGMAIVDDVSGLETAFQTATTRGARFFGTPEVLVEQYLPNARHIEVQVLGLVDGRVVALGERDCSVQRRHQKLAEETPSPGLDPRVRTRLLDAATTAAAAVHYRGAGTVEFLVFDGGDGKDFVFLEMNTRLQVEHPITEMTTGVDLVAEQLRVAQGQAPLFEPDHLESNGAAIELRVYAEDPVKFLPRPGTISTWVEPEGSGVRVDSGYRDGDTVTPHYDPLLAKLCVWGPTREDALAVARQAISDFHVEGIQTNLEFFSRLLDEPGFVSGDYTTRIVEQMIAER